MLHNVSHNTSHNAKNNSKKRHQLHQLHQLQRVSLLGGERVSCIDNFLSTSECEELIWKAEEKGFIKSPVSGGGHGRTHQEDPRNNFFTVIVDEKLAEKLWKRVQPLIPRDLSWRTWGSIYFNEKEGSGAAWKACGLVDRLRFYRYEKGQEYPEHMDGTYRREVQVIAKKTGEVEASYHQQSFLTLLIYLNDNFQGGETKFHPDYEHCRYHRNVEGKEIALSVLPKEGMALISVHDIQHQGTMPTMGTKYVLRTDILFQKPIPKNPKLEKFGKASVPRTSVRSKEGEVTVINGEWEKLFEPSCKLYHD